MRLYVAGPMRGYPEFNFPAFDIASAAARAQGIAVVSPADHDRDVLLAERGITDITTVPGFAEGDLAVYEKSIGQVYDLLTWDVSKIAMECDGVIMLAGWEKSVGARIERFVAEALDKQVYLAVGRLIPSFVLDPMQRRLTLSLAPAFSQSDLHRVG